MRLTDAATRIALKNVLLATDFSSVSESALLYAEAITRRYGSKLLAVHVILPVETGMVPPENWGSSQRAIDEATSQEMNYLDQRLQGLPHEVVLRHGRVWDVISEEIERNDVDLLVMGTHGRSGLGRLLMGSVAEGIFRQARCPVLTIGPNVAAKAAPEAEFKEIVFATDFSPASLAALPYALSLAQEYQAHLTLLHVVSKEVAQVMDAENIIEPRISELRNLIPLDAGLWCRAEYAVVFGDRAECILETAAKKKADLIVLGVRSAHGHVAAATRVGAATAHRVVSAALCPVLTVRG
jgi:nucleotide-binding universal stress UspA family protein